MIRGLEVSISFTSFAILLQGVYTLSELKYIFHMFSRGKCMHIYMYTYVSYCTYGTKCNVQARYGDYKQKEGEGISNYNTE